MYIAHHVVVGW